MLAITCKRPPQRAHCSISIPNTRFKRRTQSSATCFGIGGSGVRPLAFEPRPAGVIAARSAAWAANTPWYLVKCTHGGGTSAASRAMKSNGSSTMSRASPAGASIRHGGNMAFYSMTDDRIQLPPFEAFRNAESSRATLAHELTHWTLHPARLNREFGRKHYGDEGYAKEELVAELGAAFLCAELGDLVSLRWIDATTLSVRGRTPWLGISANGLDFASVECVQVAS